jgi:hypothetical protein
MEASVIIVAGYLSVTAGIFTALFVNRPRALPRRDRGFARTNAQASAA